MNKIFKLITLLILICLIHNISAVPYEQLSKAIEIEGIITSEGEVYCTAIVLEHATLHFYESEVFELSYYVTLFDKSGEGIMSYDFPPNPSFYGDVPIETPEFETFYLVVPYEDAYTIIVANSDEKEVCRIERSKNSPEILITNPTGILPWNSVKKIEWTMSDEDDDWLLVDVYYADDSGFGWNLLEREVDGTSLELDEPIELTRIKVIVNDGFNSAESVVQSLTASGNVNENVDFQFQDTAWFVDDDYAIKSEDYIYEAEFYDNNIGDDMEFIDSIIEIVGWLIALIVIAIILKAVFGRKKKEKPKEEKPAQEKSVEEKPKPQPKPEVKEQKPVDKKPEPKQESEPEPKKEIQETIKKEPSKTMTNKEYSDAMKVLRKRYAAGEITTQQFKEMKKELEG
ncbi:MAG: SHOCT domain-containing protein [Candidatus Diapherotrites archaeon]